MRTRPLLSARSARLITISALLGSAMLCSCSVELIGKNLQENEVDTTLVGPFAELDLDPISSLADQTLPALINSEMFTAVNPYSAATLTVNQNTSFDSSAGTAIFTRCDTLDIAAGSHTLSVAGSNGADRGAGTVGGDAGAGSSGGGGGGTGEGTVAGSSGGTGGSNGDGGIGGGQETPSDGQPGIGYFSLSNYLAATVFTFASGGNGGAGADGTAPFGPNPTGGAGGTGAEALGGGGGGGGGNLDQLFGVGNDPGGGGGGGGDGLIVLICNRINANGALTLDASGGNGGAGISAVLGNGGGGGGGVIWAAFRRYNGELSFNVAGGTGPDNGAEGDDGSLELYEISNDGSLIGPKATTDTWDNL